MSVENVYTSIACNRTTESADWGKNGLIVFGACNAIAIYDPQFKGCSAKVTHTYVRHTKRVNTVRWLKSFEQDKEVYCLSGSDDKLAILWNVENPNKIKSFELKGHESGVNAVDGLQRTNRQWLLATASADSTIKLWSYIERNEEPVCKQTILLNTGFCFTLRMILLNKTEQVLLAFTADDESIALWAENIKQEENDELKFQPVHKLLGHEDWVRGLDFVREGEDLLLASSAQDNFIRLWRIAPRTEEQVRNNKVDKINFIDETSGEIRVEEKILQLAENSWYAISLESVLYGHDNWVYAVQWYKTSDQSLHLLSASIDKTLIIWQICKENGIWMEKVRLGEVGGNSLGFFGGKFSSNGKSILGHSYQGGFHIWKQSEDNDSIWLPQVIVGGHFGEVRDLAWEPQGLYVMSVSADQTTRIHAPWRSESETWHELARPQIHGYDMQSLALLSRYKFASGAEEKIVRNFQASANFIENLRRITKVQDDKEGDQLLKTLPKGASVPSLGLSNKAVYTIESKPAEERHVKDEYPENYFTPITLDAPPQEETLMQNTLWPEVQKLYGHGYEIYALASSPDATLLASSCKSTNAEHAQIILWDTVTWKQIQKLPGHQLTVTQMRFSPDGQYLLSVSRDRRWSLFKRQSASNENNKLPSFALSACTDKTNGVHTRIIWSCDWTHDSQYFATSSREGKVVIWCKKEQEEENLPDKISSLNGWKAIDILELKNESITAVTFAHTTHTNGSYILALGCESGLIQVLQFNGKFNLLLSLNKSQSHHLTVKRLLFRPFFNNTNQFQLASCGDDCLVRIYQFNF